MRLALITPLAALALAACDSAPEPAAPAETQASNGPEAKPGLVLSEGRLVLPAVAGNPGAAYFRLVNGSGAPATIAAVSIDGAAKAEMHDTTNGAMAPLASVEVAQGETVSFAPGGKHVMAFDLETALVAGRIVEMTISFADGDKLSAPLKVEAAGGMSDHGAMN